MIENSLNIHGDEILYVGDHIYTDVSQSKVHLRWRTALICRELEEEVSHYGFHDRIGFQTIPTQRVGGKIISIFVMSRSSP